MAIINRDDVLRKVLASLVGSNLTIRELQFLASEIGAGKNFSWMLADTLNDLASRLGKGSLGRDDIGESAASDPSGLTHLALEVIRRRRVSKDKVIKAMYDSGAKSSLKGLRFEDPMKDIVEFFFSQANGSSVDRFLEWLGISVGHDPYLAGIRRG